MAITTVNLSDPVSTLVTKTNEISSNLGDKDALATVATSSLVAAINEIQAKIIQIDTPAEIAQDVETYFQSNDFDIGTINATNGSIDSLTVIDLNITDSANIVRLTVTDSANIAKLTVTDSAIFGNDIVLLDSDDIILPDNSRIMFGDDNDLQISHNGGHSVIKEEGTGGLKLQADNWVYIQGADGSNRALFKNSGPVELYHNNNKKLETTSAGVTLTGTLTGSVDVSAGTLTLANDQISGDKIQGGTIGSVSIGNATVTTLTMESVALDNIKPLQIKNSAGTTLLAGYLLSTSNTDGTL